MFGSKKNKIQVKSVEDYLRGEDARIPRTEAKSVASGPTVPPNIKLYIAQGVVLLFIVALVLVAFSQLGAVRSDVAELQAGKEGETKALKTQVAELAANLEKSKSEVAALTETVNSLRSDIEAERTNRARAEVEAARKTAAANAAKKKPAAKPTR